MAGLALAIPKVENWADEADEEEAGECRGPAEGANGVEQGIGCMLA